MPRNKIFQLSGAEKRRVAMVERVDKKRSSVSTAPKFDRFFLYSKMKVESHARAIRGTRSNSSPGYWGWQCALRLRNAISSVWNFRKRRCIFCCFRGDNSVNTHFCCWCGSLVGRPFSGHACMNRDLTDSVHDDQDLGPGRLQTLGKGLINESFVQEEEAFFQRSVSLVSSLSHR